MTHSRTNLPPVIPVLIGIALLAVPVHIKPDNFLVDDGYFYPQIARFIAQGKGSTFDGWIPTNGYHPLWMLVCVACTWVLHSQRAVMQMLLSIQDCLMLAAFAAILLIAGKSGRRGAVLCLAPLVFLSMVLGIWRLLESDLALALQLAVLTMVLPLLPGVRSDGRSLLPQSGTSRNLVLGTALGLTLLARLDLAFFVATLLLFQVFWPRVSALSSRLRDAASQAIVAGVVLAPYLVWNLVRFHHLTPISGAIKSTFPHPQAVHGFAPFVWPVVIGIVFNLLLIFKQRRSPFDLACILTAVAAALHLAYTLLFGEVAPWYLTTGYLSFTFAAIWTLDASLNRLRFPVWSEVLTAFLLFGVFACLASVRLFSNFSYTRLLHGGVSLTKPYIEPKKALGEALDSRFPPGTRVFIFDAPGGVAWHSSMSVIAVDGLVQNYTYNDDLEREGFARYSKEHHIQYFIAPILQQGQTYDRLMLKGTRGAGGQLMEVYTPLRRRDAGGVLLQDDQLVFTARDPNPELELSMPLVGVWRINP